MKVSGVGTTAGPGGTRKTGKTDKGAAGAFAQTLADTVDSVEESHGLDAPAAVGGIDALLLVQGVGDSLEREGRRRLIARGESLLDMLEEIRHGLLVGDVPKERLIALAQMLRAKRDNVPDPRLAAILDEIELRAQVELAKLSPRFGA